MKNVGNPASDSSSDPFASARDDRDTASWFGWEIFSGGIHSSRTKFTSDPSCHRFHGNLISGSRPSGIIAKMHYRDEFAASPLAASDRITLHIHARLRMHSWTVCISRACITNACTLLCLRYSPREESVRISREYPRLCLHQRYPR